MGRFAVAVLLIVACAARVSWADPATQASLFDPSRYMRVSEVRPGMKGYGLTVFRGTKIERFDVEAIDVVRNFNPKYDVVLIRCLGDYLQHTGAIAGMSGSPIYLYDDTGKARMIGAFAYGWPMSKDPLAGVQPIQYMLDLPANAPQSGGVDEPADNPREQSFHPHWSLDDALPPWGHGKSYSQDDWRGEQTVTTPWFDREIRLTPLATPVMVGNINPRACGIWSRCSRPTDW